MKNNINSPRKVHFQIDLLNRVKTTELKVIVPFFSKHTSFVCFVRQKNVRYRCLVSKTSPNSNDLRRYIHSLIAVGYFWPIYRLPVYAMPQIARMHTYTWEIGNVKCRPSKTVFVQFTRINTLTRKSGRSGLCVVHVFFLFVFSSTAICLLLFFHTENCVRDVQRQILATLFFVINVVWFEGHYCFRLIRSLNTSVFWIVHRWTHTYLSHAVTAVKSRYFAQNIVYINGLIAE